MSSKKINLKKLNRINYDDILKDGNPILREISMDVSYPLEKTDLNVMNQMIDYVRSSQDEVQAKERNLRPAYGLSAVQLGHLKKMMFIRIENEFGGEPEEFALVNPKIVSSSTNLCYLNTGEGCLSLEKEIKGYIHRPYIVKVRAVDHFTDKEIEIEAKGLTSVILQHEIDHLYGIMFYDRINVFDKFKIENKSIKIS